MQNGLFSDFVETTEHFFFGDLKLYPLAFLIVMLLDIIGLENGFTCDAIVIFLSIFM